MTDTSITLPARSAPARPAAVVADADETPLPRWGARAGIAAPILALFATVAGAPLYADDMSEAGATGRFTIAAVATLAALIALVAALLGLYLAQHRRLHRLGHTGLLIGFTGTVLAAGGAWDTLFTVPYLAEQAPAVLDVDTSGSLLAGFVISYLTLVVGWVLFGVATLRARVLPRAGSIVMLVGAVLAFFPAPTSLRILPLAVGVALCARGVLRGAAAR